MAAEEILTRDDMDMIHSEKYGYVDDEDRGFDSFMEDSVEGREKTPENTASLGNNYREGRTFAQMSQDVPPEQLKEKSKLVLDRINSEISDLYVRELELKKIQGGNSRGYEKDTEGDASAEDEYEEGSDFSDSAIEYDGETTAGSHSSGQVSPAGPMNDLRQEESGRNLGVYGDGEDEPDRKQMGVAREIKVRPLEEHEEAPIKFLVDETPIEREMRLSKEREEEFKRSKTGGGVLAVCPVDPPPRMGSLPPAVKPREINRSVELTSLPHMPAKDMQLEIAKARVQKEIEENMKREKELARTAPSQSSSEQEVKSAETVSEDIKPEPPSPPHQQQPDLVPSETNKQLLRKPTIAKLSIAKVPAAARFFSPPAFNANKPTRITPVVSPIISRGNLRFPTGEQNPGGSLPPLGAKTSFTSFEKYLLQTSAPYMAATQSVPSTPTLAGDDGRICGKPQQFPIVEDPLRIIKAPVEENIDEDKEEAEEKPVRRYVPAQDKINREIQELAMREKELNRVRGGKWKSTLDLPEALKATEKEEEPLRRTISTTTQSTLALNTTSETEPDEKVPDIDKLVTVTSQDVRLVTRVKAPPRRRHSMLISQWEERIRQQQQQQNKK